MEAFFIIVIFLTFLDSSEGSKSEEDEEVNDDEVECTAEDVLEQWRLLGPTMKYKCNCETFLILIETFPFQKTQQLIVQGKLHHNFSVQ
mgnify:CR=1 FL=1